MRRQAQERISVGFAGIRIPGMGEQLQGCKLGLLLYEKSLILYLMIEQIGDASYGSRSKNFIFTGRTGETGNT